jgi:hypothetical protein
MEVAAVSEPVPAVVLAEEQVVAVPVVAQAVRLAGRRRVRHDLRLCRRRDHRHGPDDLDDRDVSVLEQAAEPVPELERVAEPVLESEPAREVVAELAADPVAELEVADFHDLRRHVRRDLRLCRHHGLHRDHHHGLAMVVAEVAVAAKVAGLAEESVAGSAAEQVVDLDPKLRRS